MTPCRLSAFDPSDEVVDTILDAWTAASFLACRVGLALVYVVCLAALMRDRQERLIPAPAGVRVIPAPTPVLRRRHTPPARRPRAARRGTVSP